MGEQVQGDVAIPRRPRAHLIQIEAHHALESGHLVHCEYLEYL